MTLFRKQKQTHRYKNIYKKKTTNLWLPKGKVKKVAKLGVWDQRMQAIVYKTDKQGPTVQKRELCSVSCNKV